MDEKTLQRFWSKVDKNGPVPEHAEHLDSCWIWTAGLNRPGGYGSLWVHGRHELAHRLSWESFCSPIPGGNQVLHKCDNPRCVNPTHLMLGTNADNVADMVKKGRQARGAKATMAKLSDEQAVEIRSDYLTGLYTKTALGIKYNVHRSTILQVVIRGTWKHV